MFNDVRSKKVIFVAHCLLNQNSISDGTAVCPAGFQEMMDYFLEAGIGIVQMPCPELSCLGLDRGNIYGADSPVVVENTRIRAEMKKDNLNEKLNKLVEYVIQQIVEYHKYGFDIIGIIGANRSPNCGVETTSDHIVLICAGVISLMKTPADITNIHNSTSITTGMSNGKKITEDSLQWYNTIEEAKQDVSLIDVEDMKDKYFQENTAGFLQIPYENRIAEFYMVPNGEESQTGNDTVTYFLYQTKDGKISQPYWRYSYHCDVNKGSHYRYDFDDSVAYFIINENMLNKLPDVQYGFPFYFGIWQRKEDVESLTVLGVKPKIVSVKASGTPYYFWYFEDVDWSKPLSTIDWSDYTYGEIIKLLEIKY